jgi:hypothetical protein
MLKQNISNFVSKEELLEIWKVLTSKNNWGMTGDHKIWRYRILNHCPNLILYVESDKNTWLSQQHDAMQSLDPIWKKIFDRVQDLAGPNFLVQRYAINGQSQGQGVNIHQDVISNPEEHSTFLIYLNPEWLPEFGGYTEFYDSNNSIIYRELPEPGKLIEYDSKIKHAGTVPIVPEKLRVTMAIQGMYDTK